MQDLLRILLAPPPGLEPGTYGLIVGRSHFLMALSSKNSNEFFDASLGWIFAPNLCRTCAVRYFRDRFGSRIGSTEKVVRRRNFAELGWFGATDSWVGRWSGIWRQLQIGFPAHAEHAKRKAANRIKNGLAPCLPGQPSRPRLSSQ